MGGWGGGEGLVNRERKPCFALITTTVLSSFFVKPAPRWGHGGGGSSIVKVPRDVPPTRVYFFGLLV